MKFAIIDTNIILDCALRRKRGHGPQLIEELESTLAPRDVVLLMPEVVELELGRQWEDALNRIRQDVEAAQKQAKPAIKKLRDLAVLAEESVNLPSERHLAEAAEKVIGARRRSRDSVRDKFQQLLSNQRVLKLPLTPVIHTESSKRVISGLPPFQLDTDSLIVETLIDFFRGLRENIRLHGPALQLLLCTANKKHFDAIAPDFAPLGVEVLLYPSLTGLIEGGLKVEIDQTELSRYRYAQEVLGVPASSPDPVESKVAFFAFLMDVLDHATQYLLGCALREPEPFTKQGFDQAYSQFSADKRRTALEDLCTAGLLIVQQGAYSATPLAGEFMDEVILSGWLFGYRARGDLGI